MIRVKIQLYQKLLSNKHLILQLIVMIVVSVENQMQQWMVSYIALNNYYSALVILIYFAFILQKACQCSPTHMFYVRKAYPKGNVLINGWIAPFHSC